MVKQTLFCIIYFALLISDANAAATCENIFSLSPQGLAFSDLKYAKTSLDENIPVTAWQGSLMSRREKFINKYPNNAKVVQDVHFKYTDPSDGFTLNGYRDVLVISLHDASPNVLKDYLDFISIGTISFPLSRGGGHLYTRFGVKAYDHLRTINVNDYKLPQAYRLETVVLLPPVEFKNMADYITTASRNYDKVVGAWSYNGSLKTRGKIDDNTCLIGGHNCTSWLATIGIGRNGERFQELLGGDLAVDVGTNPGWWSLFLNTQANRDLVPFTVFWTDKPLSVALKEQVRSHQTISSDAIIRNEGSNPVIEKAEWDFAPH